MRQGAAAARASADIAEVAEIGHKPSVIVSLQSSHDRRKAELERHKMPVPTPPVKARPAEGARRRRRPGVALGGGSGGDLFQVDPAYAFRGEMQAEKDPAPLPTATISTAKMSHKAAAPVQKPALKKDKPTEPGPTPAAPMSGPRPRRALPLQSVARCSSSKQR